jgi:hypothetical protein
MTLLVGGSVLLIATSAVALAVGWANADESLIFTSIAASSAAAVLLALAYFRSRSEPAPAGSYGSGDVDSGPATAPMAAVTEDGAGEVVAVPDRKKYHRADCRYAGAKSAATMTVGEARREGYSACGVCKP